MNELSPVPIKYMVYPDFQVVAAAPRDYGDKIWHFKYSLVLSDNLIVEERCTEDGVAETYHKPVYYSCRIKNDMIEILDSENCWIPAHCKLNDIYRDSLANKELVGS